MRFKTTRIVLVGLIASLSIVRTLPHAVAQTTDPNTELISQTETETSKLSSLRERIADTWQNHQNSIVLVGVLIGSYLSVLWLRPLWLLKIPSADVTLPWTNWKIPLGIVRFLKYRNRVLDSWVEQHWKTAQTIFSNIPTVSERKIHVVLPIYLNKKLIEELDSEALRETFSRKSAVLLICGEGGSGKTSFACQLAYWGLKKQLSSHRMLPVLIESELDSQRSLFEVVRGQLNILTNQADPLMPELIEKLLYRQRILVILDHLSEMSETTRKQVTPDLSNFPARSLVVTSRLNESLGGIPKTVLEPLRIKGSRLSRFMDAYLEQRDKRDLFEDEDYFDACRRLSRIVGQRNITVLLAKLYADQMIEQQQGAGGTLPASVPELMLSYINQLNRTIESSKQRSYTNVHRDAQMVAWECLKHTYRPTSATKIDIINSLAANLSENINNSDEANERLIYLEERLQLLQTIEPGNKVRIVLDPLAEYLAALQLLSYCQQEPEELWRQFLDSIGSVLERTKDSPEAIQGFLLAVRDCCLLKQKEALVPDYIPERLAQKAGLDPEELRQIEEKRRIRLLASDLSAPELSYRVRAAKDLGNRGLSASLAVPNLLGMMENPNQAAEARREAAHALGKLGNCSEIRRRSIEPKLVSVLQDNDDDVSVRRSAAEALGAMKAGRTELLTILENDNYPITLRQGAAYAISLIGLPSGRSIPMLIVERKDNRIDAQIKRIDIWQDTLTPEITLKLVQIPGGEFVMGSPPGEAGRDVYPHNVPDAEGIDVERQHMVKLPPFKMSQFPITQAQWRVIAALPAIDKELSPEPSSFEGDLLPVETVSWDDAMEFCARLSKLSGSEYRLPSEAEWEYACRAGTITQFHFGETLWTDVANYNGNYIYGPGVKGEDRRSTTEVGSFGVVNKFGLGDMHGNVWEWCLDCWHTDYGEAPADGSAWTTGGDERYRILRGGSWYGNPEDCRSAFRRRYAREYHNSNRGFRVVCGFLDNKSDAS